MGSEFNIWLSKRKLLPRDVRSIQLSKEKKEKKLGNRPGKCRSYRHCGAWGWYLPFNQPHDVKDGFLNVFQIPLVTSWMNLPI